MKRKYFVSEKVETGNMKYQWIYLFLKCMHFICINTDAKSLGRFIKHYEELEYSTKDLHCLDLLSKRSPTNEPFQFAFNAFQRDFIVVLEPDESVFSKDAALEITGPSDTSHIYVGHVKGYKGSRVYGYILEGYFNGSIKIPQETTYYIEPAKRFIGIFKEDPKAHSVIYKQEDIVSDMQRFQKESDIEVASSWNNKANQWMQNVVRSGFTNTDEMSYYNRERKNPELNHSNGIHNRHKRETLVNKNTCFLYLQADPMLFNQINSAYNNEVLAMNDIIGLFNTHVDAINTIYANTVFRTYDNSISYSGVRFKIQKIKIMTDTTEKCSTSQASKFCDHNTDVVNFLNLHSQSNYSDFCLAYTFTYRDFSNDSLGFAWMGYSGQPAGGICDKYKSFTENGLSVMKSLNTGVVTLLNNNNSLTQRMSQLSFAHQVGHSFGSPHDSGNLCTPYDNSAVDAEQRNYIMNEEFINGNMQHNDEFSPCSKDNMTKMLDKVFTDRFGTINCFKSMFL
ncbi:disintegrin and metalloproteinase domain-containing protein 10-like [Mytilus californianus]|uniref:disintegrin and metalloproteinase domain-containing protein 10-like n=1 Tax=Mytilus californianus TaxID=6549 RepID=UPI002247C20E|nr:disintegrin and metalloproteinase domain-containing protein 10-like [Mytilus californianus]